jgi:hypothetical protein
MGERRIEGKVTTMERFYRAPFPWELRETKNTLEMACDMTTAHARVVEFIAKPGKNFDLRKRIMESVLPFLEQQPGFKNAFVLTPHREPRLVLVFSFWEKELDSRENQWECAAEIQRAVLPLVDNFSRVRTYQAMFPDALETKAEPAVQLGEAC